MVHWNRFKNVWRFDLLPYANFEFWKIENFVLTLSLCGVFEKWGEVVFMSYWSHFPSPLLFFFWKKSWIELLLWLYRQIFFYSFFLKDCFMQTELFVCSFLLLLLFVSFVDIVFWCRFWCAWVAYLQNLYHFRALARLALVFSVFVCSQSSSRSSDCRCWSALGPDFGAEIGVGRSGQL